MDHVKLLLYSHFFAPSVGGVETTVLALARGLSERKRNDGKYDFELTVVTQTEASGYNDGEFPFRVMRKPGLWELAKVVKNCDVVHLAGPALMPFVLALVARKPVVIVHHGFQAICPNGQLYLTQENGPCPGHFMAGRHSECIRCNRDVGLPASVKLWLLTFVRRFLCKHASINIMETDWSRGLLKLPRARTIPLGLKSLNLEKQTLARMDPPVIAFLGRLVTTKGIGILLEAAKILREQGREFRLRVIGDGPERRNLDEAAKTPPLAGAVQFLGRISTAAVGEELSRASVIVVPSLAGEVFGRAVAENMQRGLPVIGSDLGSFQEVLGDAGLTFRTGDAADLARQICRVLDDPEFAAGLGERAAHRIENQFNYVRMLEEQAEVYEHLTKR